MKILSLFDGISCGRVALERAGIPVEVYYASEIDKYATQISEKNYPDIIRLGDVCNITKEMVGEVDLIMGGSPCQSFSNAGSRTGFEGKSGLFYEFVRLVKEIQPKYFLLENVKMKQEWQDIISQELGVKPVLINSSLVSGQNRQRLYWVGKLQEDGNYKQVYIPQPEDKQIYLQDILQEEVEDKYYLTESNIKTINRNFGSKGKVINLDETSLIEKMTYPSRINQKFGQIKSPTLVAAMGTGGGNVPVVFNLYNSRIFNEKSGTIGTCNGLTNIQGHTVLNKNGFRKLTPIECERLQTLPDNYTEGVSNTQRYKAIGNGWTVDVVAHILKNLTNN